MPDLQVTQAGAYVEVGSNIGLVTQAGAYVEMTHLRALATQVGTYVEIERPFGFVTQAGMYVELLWQGGGPTLAQRLRHGMALVDGVLYGAGSAMQT